MENIFCKKRDLTKSKSKLLLLHSKTTTKTISLDGLNSPKYNLIKLTNSHI